MRFPAPESIVPERKPARTPTGKRTLKKRTKTEINALYVEALGSNVLATVKEAFATGPGTETVRLLVTRRETDKKNARQLAAIYFGEFDRGRYENPNSASPGKSLALASGSILNLKGKTEQVEPIDLVGLLLDVCDVHLYIVNRTQIYLDETQTARLDERAAAEGTTRSTVIRRAVDLYLTQEEQDSALWREQWRNALTVSAGRAADLKDGSEYVEDIRSVDAERLSRLDR